jgi:pimeloyl-ACP methyl ester carboxylesterase
VELAVDVAGSGPGLLLVHGFGGAKEDFADHVPALAVDHTVVVVDHRGHGASDGPDDPAAYSPGSLAPGAHSPSAHSPSAHSFERLVTDMFEVADALGLVRFRLLGHSMGGMVARRMVLERPDRIEALVLMDTAPGPIPAFDVDLMDAGGMVALTQGKAALKELLDLGTPLNTPAYERLLADRPGYQEFQDQKWDALSEVMWGVLVSVIAHQADDLPELATITCPTLVIVGELDQPFLAPSRAMAETIPDARLAVIPDAGHSPQFENPEAWISALKEFLARVPSAS